MAKLLLEVLTPEKVAHKGEVSSVYLEGGNGRLGILPGHTALISTLSFGLLEFEENGQDKQYLCGDGLVETAGDRVTVLVRSAESSKNIDVERAKRALERAKSRLHSRASDVNMMRAELALYRAMERLKFTKHI